MTQCIIPKDAEKLREAFKKGEISIAKLHDMKSSSDRVKALEKYVGDSAKFTVAGLEKAFISPNMKTSMRNWIYKNVGRGTPLYKGVSLDQAEKMSKELDVRGLRKLNTEERTKVLSAYVDKDVAKQLSERYGKLKKTNNLQNWEKRVTGTKTLRDDKRLKGALAKLEALDNMGVLMPENAEEFMETFVEDSLGVNVTVEEANKTSDLVNKQLDAYDKVMANDDWTANNGKAVEDFFMASKKLEDYSQLLAPVTPVKVGNDIINVFRGNILFSLRIIKNSAIYQTIPSAERAIVKRIVSGNMNDADMQSSVHEKILAKVHGISFSKEDLAFVAKQVALGMKIYHKTGYDISRLENLSDGKKYFGEKASNIVTKPMKDAKGFWGKLGVIAGNYGKVVNLAPKWLAGGTDSLIANWTRADTSVMKSREIARMEAIKGKLPEGMTEKERASQLLRDSYSFNPKDPKAARIRASAILDAHRSNGTQKDGLGDTVIKMREAVNIKGLKFGKLILPFAKISSTILSESLKTATGYGVVKSLVEINNANKKENLSDRARLMEEGVGNLVRYAGLYGAAVLLASMLDPDDYLEAYDGMSYKEYKIAVARGGSPDRVRIGGKWTPLRYFPLISISLVAIMSARKAMEYSENKPEAFLSGYAAGVFGQLLQTPGVKESYDIVKKMKGVAKAEDVKNVVDSLGFEYDKISDWLWIRILPSMISYDLKNRMFPKDSKYDFLGREREKTNFWGFKDDKTIDLITEISRLEKLGHHVTIGKPRGDYPEEKLVALEKMWAELVKKDVASEAYKGLPDEEKAKQISHSRKEVVNKGIKPFKK